MKLKMTLVAALVMMVSNTSAAVFEISNRAGGLLIQLADGSLSNGGIVTMGYFYSAPSSNLADIATTISNFTILASGLTGSYNEALGGSFDGYVDTIVQGPAVVESSPLIGKQLYTFAGDASTLGTSTQWALDLVGTIMGDDPIEQTYDALGGGLPPINEIVDPGFNVIVSPLPGFGPIIGSYDYFNGSPTLRLVPEPSTALLGVFGASVLLYRRRA